MSTKHSIAFCTGTILEKLFWSLFSFIMAIICCAAFSLTKDWYGNSSLNLKCFFLVILFWAILVLITWLIKKYIVNGRTQIWFGGCIVVLIALVAHVMLVAYLAPGSEQISDYLQAYETACSEGLIDEIYWRNFTHWLMYILYQRILFSIFGQAQVVVIWANAIITTACAGMLYGIVWKITKFWDFAVICALVFTFWPTFFVYSLIMTPEFLNIFFSLMAILLFVSNAPQISVNKEKANVLNVFGVLLSGISLGWSGFFKPIDKIIIIASVITLIVFLLKKREVNLKKLIALLLILIAGYVVSTNLGRIILKNNTKGELNSSPVYDYLLIGFDPESGGSYNAEIYGKYLDNSKEYGFDKANEIAKEDLKFLFQGEKSKWGFTFWFQKIKTGFGNDSYSFFVWNTIASDCQVLFEGWNEKFDRISQMWYLGTLLLITSMGVFSLIAKSDRNQLNFFFALLMMGMFFVIMIGEVQPRYKCVVVPYMSCLASYTVFIGKNQMAKIYEKSKKETKVQ